MKIIALLLLGSCTTVSALAAFNFSTLAAERNGRNRSCGIEQRGSCFRFPGSHGWECHLADEGCYIFKGRRGCSVVCSNPIPIPGQDQ